MKRMLGQMLEQRYLINPLIHEEVTIGHWREGCKFPGIMPNVVISPSKLASCAMVCNEFYAALGTRGSSTDFCFL